MKALPKRKGNAPSVLKQEIKDLSLNESPSEKEGKFAAAADLDGCVDAASMKALPKRKGNLVMSAVACGLVFSLNESPSEKEGK